MPDLKKKIKIHPSVHEKLVRNVKTLFLNVKESEQKKIRPILHPSLIEIHSVVLCNPVDDPTNGHWGHNFLGGGNYLLKYDLRSVDGQVNPVR